MAYLSSPLQWAGGKGKVLHHLLPVLHEHRQDGFCEPFVGACNVSLNFDAGYYIWNDLNKDLIRTYEFLVRSPKLYKEVCEYFFQKGFDEYYELRDTFNELTLEGNASDMTRVALFQYLNKHGFNGLCRYNRSGKFNVPVGTSTKPKSVPVEQIDNFFNRFANAIISTSSFGFEEVFERAGNCSSLLIYCFDKETELLTKDGWKFVKDITTEDLCLSREVTSNTIDWVGVSKTHSRVYEGEMYKYDGKSVDVFVTKDHKLLLQNNRSGKNIKTTAYDALGKKLNWVCGGGIWERDQDKIINICGVDMPKQSFAYILGIFVTDGCVNNQGSITISQTKVEVLIKIKEHLNKCGIDFSEYEGEGSNKTIYIARKFLPFFQQFYLKNERCIPREFLDSDIDTLSALLDGIIDGDGDNAKERKHIRVSLGSKSLVDNIMEIAVKLGKSSNYSIRQPKESYLKKEGRIIKGQSIYYVVSINETEYRVKRKVNESLVDYKGLVFCVTLTKWNNVLMRRNGKMCWIGQCDPPYVPLTSDFNYTCEGFGWEQQVLLKQLSKQSKHTAIISNHWTPLTEQLYNDADEIHVFDVQRTISCKGSERKRVQECIVVYKGE